MTAAFWVLLVMYLVKTVGFFWLLRRHELLAKNNDDLRYLMRQTIESRRKVKTDSDRKAAEYRAAYRDLIHDFTRLHMKYKELQNDRRNS